MVNGRTYRSGSSGDYVLKGMPEGKVMMVAEAKSKGVRYLAVQTVFLNKGQGQAVDMELRVATDVDAFCSECHPYKTKTSPRQIIRDAHRSGFKPKKAMREPGMLDERGMVTCESCHTIHQDTGIPHFVLYPYEKGILCNRCH